MAEELCLDVGMVLGQWGAAPIAFLIGCGVWCVDNIGVEIDTLVESQVTDLSLLDKSIDALDEVIRDIRDLEWCQDLVDEFLMEGSQDDLGWGSGAGVHRDIRGSKDTIESGHAGYLFGSFLIAARGWWL
jgi:hypothetical protein